MSTEKANTPEYPEHEKLKKVQKESQACGSLLEWLQSEKGILFRKWDEEDEMEVPVNRTITDILSEYFEIDQNKLEQEKLAMLDSCRKLNEKVK